MHHINAVTSTTCFLKPGIADAICLKLGIIFRYPKASAKITFHMVKAVMVTIENEVKPMEDDDTVVLTPEDIEKIQKEMLEKDNEKDNEEQEED